MNTISSYSQINTTSLVSKEINLKENNNDNIFFNDELMAKISNFNSNLNEIPQIASNDDIKINSMDFNLNKIKFSQNAYGYSVDNNGFMGDDFNKAAGLPQDFKIHKSSVDEFTRYSTKVNYINSILYSNVSGNFFGNDMFENIDIADTFRQYYNVFSQALGKSLDKDFFSEAELENLPKGYTSNRQNAIDINRNLNDKTNIDFLANRTNEVVSNVYFNSNDLNEAKNLKKELDDLHINFNVNSLNFSPNTLKNNQNNDSFGFNPDMSVYENEKGHTKEALFMSFLKSENPTILEGGKTKVKDSVLANNIIIANDTARYRNISQEIAYYQGIADNYKKLQESISQLLRTGLLNLNENKVQSFTNNLYEKIANLNAKTIRV